LRDFPDSVRFSIISSLTATGPDGGRVRSALIRNDGKRAAAGQPLALDGQRAVLEMSEDEIVAVLSAADVRRVFLFRFTDGNEVELTDPCVRTIEDGKRECIATVVREAPGVEAASGSALCFALDEVAEVRLSPKSFEYFR
jgi:hypothetical protein